MNDDDESTLTLIRVCGSTEAEMIREMLGNNGIECNLQGDSAAHAIPAIGDLDAVRVWVRSEDAEAARELTNAFFQNDSSPI